MFKKIEIWILFLTIFLGLLFSIFFGVLVRQELVGNTKFGIFSKTALFFAEMPSNIKALLLESDIHVRRQNRFQNNGGFEGKPLEDEVYLLLSRFDGDMMDGIVELIDLRNFEVLHTWNPNLNHFNSLVPPVDEFKFLSRDSADHRKPLMHPKLTNDGGLLFHWESPLRKINACSELVFQNYQHVFHHAIETDEDGNIWVPAYLYPQSLPKDKIGRKNPMNEGYKDDAIIKLTNTGEVIFKKSVSEIFIENDLEYLLFSVGNSGSHKDFHHDPIHLNDIQPVDFDGPYWTKGDIFISLRHQSMVLLYRPSENKIIWKGVGPFFHQHDVNILDETRISVFNNNSKTTINGDKVDGNNEIIIYDFKTNSYSKYFSNSLIDHDVRTIRQGRGKILPNGDLFIEESNYARTLYFDNDGTLRWSHINKAKNGKVYAPGWSRILYSDEDINNVSDFLSRNENCDT